MVIIKKPSVNKNVLILLSGIMWSCVGVLLNIFACQWFVLLTKWEIFGSVSAGVILGTSIALFGFKKMVQKNIARIDNYPDKVCVFAFQEWKTYLIIGFMMSLGIFMRTTSFVPKPILTVIYIGIGFALFVSGLEYYKYLIKKEKM